jgi:hypothetical protein
LKGYKDLKFEKKKKWGHILKGWEKEKEKKNKEIRNEEVNGQGLTLKKP